MCGIAGVLAGPSAATPSMDELQRMIAMIGHRGPDGHGFYRDERIGLAHARLSLIDLAGGFQPIHNQDRSIWLTFNGEIFNYLELRAKLSALGHRFYTAGDAEVIVHCYQRYGPAAWAMLNGQFAFALWDGRHRRLWLVRDRMGILPLHFARVGQHIVFASEAKALFAGGRIAPEFDPQGLAQTFSLWSTTAPQTLFKGVQTVRPATALCIDAEMRQSEQRYWQVDPAPSPLGALTVEEAVEGLEDCLTRAVELRLRADVPVGSYLSGGLDSSVIGSLGRAQVGSALETFGIRFEDSRFDESEEQRRVARHLGARHHEAMCDAAVIRDTLADVVWHCESPLLRTAPVPMFRLARLVRSRATKAVLSGEGADELLAGYTIFKEDQIRRFWARQPDSRLRPALLSRIHHYVGDAGSRSTSLWQGFFRRGLQDTGHPFYSHVARWQNTAWTLRLLAPEVRSGFDLGAAMEAVAGSMPSGWRAWDPLARAQLIEVNSFMSSYLLSSQGDRVAMAHGVEVRYPFLDPDVIDFCMALPKRHKLLGLRDKLVLRRLAARRLPVEVSRRRKQPFRAPMGPVLFGPEARGQFDDLLEAGNLGQEGLVDGAPAALLLAKARRQDGRMSGEREDMGLVGILTLVMLARQFAHDFAGRLAEALRQFERSPLHVLEDRVTGNGTASRAAVPSPAAS